MTRIRAPRLLRSLGVVIAAGALTLSVTATPGAAGEITRDLPRPDDSAGTAAVLAALERDLGLSAAEAADLADRQVTAYALLERLETTLGAAYAGAWFDADSGALVVATTDATAARLVRAEGAQVELVDRSLSELRRIDAQVTAMVQADPAGLTEIVAWRVDAPTNQLVVTVQEGHADVVDSLVAEYGAAVRVEETAFAPSLTNHGGEPFLDGGIEYSSGLGTCSAGFTGTNGVNNFILTAAHCGSPGTQTSHAGIAIGPFVHLNTGIDSATIRVDNAFWTVRPRVWTYSGGGTVTVTGAANAVVGAPMCKSGRTTGVTCGTVTGVGETVNFGGLVVSNLTRHNACVEPGDSGGSNYGPPGAAGVTAFGTSTGGQLFFGLFCLSRLGLQNVSWYAPIVPATQQFGVSVLTG